MKNKLVYIAHQVGGSIQDNVKSILQICHEVHKADNNIIPFAPYIVALQYLDDTMVEERELGMQANREHFRRQTMDEVWLCGPRISKGMKHEIQLALKHNIPIICHNPALKADYKTLLQKNSPKEDREIKS